MEEEKDMREKDTSKGKCKSSVHMDNGCMELFTQFVNFFLIYI
jgi:hypothetical protein